MKELDDLAHVNPYLSVYIQKDRKIEYFITLLLINYKRLSFFLSLIFQIKSNLNFAFP